MGHAALLLRDLGHHVEGVDANIYPPMSEVLARADIRVHLGWDADRLATLKPDLVVVGNALGRGNPEVEWLLEQDAIAYTSLPALIHDHVLPGRRSLVVAGTHGKSTTTALAAMLLRAMSAEPGWLVGGVPRDLPSGQHCGNSGSPFVIEGDEYDSAFFDKRSKFIHYRPHILVLNNLEFDHADIFRDLADIQRTFRHVTRLVPRSGAILVNGDDPHLAEILPAPWTEVFRVGTGPDNDLRIGGFREGPDGTRFDLFWKGHHWHRIEWQLPGLFNARNAAMSALASGLMIDRANPTRAVRVERLSAAEGMRRRHDRRAAALGRTVIEDFGHHPTAIAATLESLRARHPAARITACFEPRTNTSRLRRVQDAFAQAFARADAVRLGPVHRPELIAEAERFDPAAVVEFLRARGVDARAFPSNTELLADLRAEHPHCQPATRPELIVFFTNGAFDGIVTAFANHVAPGPA